jgi:hypothetical protein
LPEWLGALVAGLLRVETDVAQNVRVQLSQAVALTTAGEGNGQSSESALENAGLAAQVSGLDMGMGHLRLLDLY